MTEIAPDPHKTADPPKKKPKLKTAEGICPFSTREIVDKLLLFCEAVNGIEFYSYQRVFARRIIESMLLKDSATITALFSRQSGKSKTVSSVALGIAILLPVLARAFPNDERLIRFADGVWIGVYAPLNKLSGPIYITLRDQAHNERCTQVLNDPEINVGIVQSRGDSLAFSNGSVITADTASEGTMCEGKTHHLILIDEAQRLSKAKVDKELRPMLAATAGTMVKIGTAWMARGGFHNDIQFNMAEEQRSGVRNHFQFDWEQVCKEKRALYNRQKKEYDAWRAHADSCPLKDTDHSQCNKKQAHWRTKPANDFHLNYEQSCTTEIARLGGVDTEEFKMNFRLLWQDSRTIAIREEVFQRGCMPGAEMNVPKMFGKQFAGLDVAKDDDSTVLTIGELDMTQPIMDPSTRDKDGNPVLYYRKYILAWLELQGSFERQYDSIVQFLRDFNVGQLLVDSTGVGDPVMERLQVLLSHINVEGFKFGTSSKSDLYKFYIGEWEANRIWYPQGEQTIRHPWYQKFEKQHKELEREHKGSYLSCAAAEGEHDDYPDSAALMVWSTRQVVMPVVEPDSTPYMSNGVLSRQAASAGYGGYSHGNGVRAERYRSGRR